MEATLTKSPEAAAVPAAPADAKRGRRTRQQTEETTRYFLSKEGSSPEKPELGPELANEGEALIKAFQSKSGVIYALLAYKAEAEIQGGSPTIVKRPVRK